MEITIIDDVGGGIINDAILLSGGSANSNFGGHGDIYLQSTVGNNLIRVVLSDYSGSIVTYSKFGLDMYLPQVGNVIDWHQVIAGDWEEGVGFGGAAQIGDVSYNNRIHNTVPWSSGGCRGDGVDRVALADGSLQLVGVDNDLTILVSNPLTQFWLDNPSSNFGLIMEFVSGNSSASRARSTDAGLGNLPYFYMEYTEAVASSGGIPRSRIINLGGV